MKELSITEVNIVSGGGFLTGMGVLLIFCYVGELDRDVKKILDNTKRALDLNNELLKTKSQLETYRQLYGELPANLDIPLS